MADRTQMRASIYTLGCRLNHGESARIVQQLEDAGYAVVPFGEPSDLGIIHTCTVTAEADAKSRKVIRGFLRRNPQAFVAVIGCYAQVMGRRLAAISGVDLVIGNARKFELLSFVKKDKNPNPVIVCDEPSAGKFELPAHRRLPREHRPNLKIQDGCDCRCSYCIVPLARGPSRSRDFGNIIEEARLLAEGGIKEVVLSGVNVGDYRCEGYFLVDVIDALNGVEGLGRIRIGSLELSGVSAPILERMRDPFHKLVPFVHVPLQSGSNRILERMNRPGSADEFMRFAVAAVDTVHDLCIGVDVMVGFPGETDEDFQATVQLLRETPVAYAHVFPFSPRPGTLAERMPDRIDPRTTQARSQDVRRIASEKRSAFHGKFLGRTMDVLFEQEIEGRREGYTGNYIRVFVCCARDLSNEQLPVLLKQDSGESVEGVILD